MYKYLFNILVLYVCCVKSIIAYKSRLSKYKYINDKITLQK